ncbi:MAG: hypothetical protein O2960_05170 [Verrucomicrobia bacterium]|nr:hypothetical protein [Verrucomicrobiota bacterium]
MRILTLLSCTLAWSISAISQEVSVQLVFDQKYFLPNEALIVKVRVTNYSGQTLRLGNDPDWISFNIEGRNSRLVSSLGVVPLEGDYTLDSSNVGEKPVDLAPYFDLSQPDHYTITANIKIPQWNRSIKSDSAVFDIVSGTKLWSQDFGVPLPPGAANGLPEVREYSLLQTLYRSHLMLYFRVTSVTDSKVLKVYPIGPMVSFSKPEPQLDKYSNIHILYQTGARRFTYSVVNPDGLLIARETHDYSDTRPVLQSNEEGRISVRGGVRRITTDDLPPPSGSALVADDGNTRE